MNNFQRLGAISNAHAGNDFELLALKYFDSIGLTLQRNYPVKLGFNVEKVHRFDLGGNAEESTVIVECKSHKWTSGDNIPGAKLTVWNEVMLYFSLVPNDVKKILFVLRDYSAKRKATLASYYVRIYGNLIPNGVTIIEYDTDCDEANVLYES
jgi:hypothetical protein